MYIKIKLSNINTSVNNLIPFLLEGFIVRVKPYKLIKGLNNYMRKRTIALVGTFDTKGEEYEYIIQLLADKGLEVLTIHSGVFPAKFSPDVDNNVVAKEAGEQISYLVERNDRSYATEVLAKGLESLIPKLYGEGKFDGIMSFGGSGGTSLVSLGMKALPIGVPKIIVSTMAGGDVSPYVGTSDIIMIPSIVDISGLNKISRAIFQNAVSAMIGMVTVQYEEEEASDKEIIAATMFGVTTPAVTSARKYLEKLGYEVLVFHATGSGGKSMERLIANHYIDGVLDLTTTEWVDEVVGGVLTAGPHRLEEAALNNIPQVVSLGALDMVNFGPYETVPEKFLDRKLYKHNPTVTLMRTTKEENKKIGEKIAEKLNMAKDYTTLIIPLKGLSAIDQEGEIFYGKEEDSVLFKTIIENLDQEHVTLIERDETINDANFAEFAAQELVNMMNRKGEEKDEQQK